MSCFSTLLHSIHSLFFNKKCLGYKDAIFSPLFEIINDFFFSFFLLFSLSQLFLSFKKFCSLFIVCVFHVGSLPQVFTDPWLTLIFCVCAELNVWGEWVM